MKMQNILIATDSFKGSSTSINAANAIKKGFNKEGFNEVICVPMADGGEGTVDAMIASTGGTKIHVKVKGPMHDDVEAFYGISGDGSTAVIEMAAASGLMLVKGEKNPMKATTYGTGQLMKDAADRGCKKIILGLGGSATNDGGCGMACALGAKFKDEQGNILTGGGGGCLTDLYSIDISEFDKRFNDIDIEVACDVTNPLCGEHGASFVYGPQKGASPGTVMHLEAALLNFAQVVKRDLHKDILNLEGSGAAGGLGGGLVAFTGAELKRGIDIVIRATNLEDKIKKADLVITGEGQTDYQTEFGKVPAGIAALCKKHNKPLIIMSGALGDNYKSLYNIGVTAIFSICDKPMSLDQAMKNTEPLLYNLSRSIARLYK